MEAATPGAAVATLPRSEEWLRAARLTRLLSWLSLVWLGVEGAVAIVAGVMAGSVALIAFGLDSAIEGVASVVIIWRFSGSRLLSEAAERRAQVLVAAQFFILAPFITYEGLEKLVTGGDIETSWLGIGLTIATLAICQPLGLAKRRLGAKLGSSATVWGGHAEPPLRLPGDRRARRPARQHALWHLVARPGGGPRDRSRRRAGGTQGTAW
jgi:hypothetical protein